MAEARRGHDRRAGFVLIELLVATAVAAILIVQVTRLARDRRFGVDELVATTRATAIARSLLAEVSRRDAPTTGERTGELDGHGWRVVVTPTTCVSPTAPSGTAVPVEACPKTGWVLDRVQVEVTIAEERRTSLETWRLARPGG